MEKQSSGFTIVELLVVIVVIGILAAVTIVSFTGISQRAVAASLQTDLDNASRQLKLYQVDNSTFPTTLNISMCPQLPIADTTRCLRPSGSNIYSNYSANSSFFYLLVRNGSVCYDITNDALPAINTDCVARYVTIGSQTWMTKNMNVGSKIATGTDQTNTGTVEKYCYDGLESNCTSDGGLYQWGEAVQYLNGASNTSSPNPVFSGNIQGICPSGFHIPSDSELSTLTAYLGDATAGQQLRSDGTSGFNGIMAGLRVFSGAYSDRGSWGYIRTSSESNATYAWVRFLSSTDDPATRAAPLKTMGYTVRCMMD